MKAVATQAAKATERLKSSMSETSQGFNMMAAVKERMKPFLWSVKIKPISINFIVQE